ncbi:MAG: hypothetical protein IJX39_08200 [Clostridia bacterium]|nr:hypothetical protein [Clostridia bacterium]
MPSEERIRQKMADLAAKIDYVPQNLQHLASAMYCKKEAGRENYTNDAMATVGDAVLKLIWSEYFFDKGFDKDEISAKKADAEKNATLKQICDRVGIYAYAYNDAYFSDEAPRNQRLPYGNHDIYLEAIVAAVYRDRGLEYAREWVLKFWKKHTDIRF